MLDIVIVNWNGGSLLEACVTSALAHNNGCVRRVIVVDNGSADGSIDAVEGLAMVEVICVGENLGFGAACNVGAAACTAPYLLFLNPDTEVTADSFSVPLQFMDSPQGYSVGICGIQLVDEDGKVSRTCARFPTLWGLTVSALGLEKLLARFSTTMRMVEWDHCDTKTVDQVMGAFFLIRRELFEELEGFDERFFVYFEEVDLSLRAREAGWISVYLSEVQAFHVGGGTSRQVKAHRLFYSLRSRLLYGFKHFSRWQAWLLVGITGVVEPVSRTVWCLAQGDTSGVRHTWAAYRMLWRGMGRIIRGDGRFVP